MNYRPARGGGKVEYSEMASVWFGISKSLQNLEEYVDIDYTIDGDSVHSKFGTSFEFGYYDEDNIEICFYENNKREIQFEKWLNVLKGTYFVTCKNYTKPEF